MSCLTYVDSPLSAPYIETELQKSARLCYRRGFSSKVSFVPITRLLYEPSQVIRTLKTEVYLHRTVLSMCT